MALPADGQNANGLTKVTQIPAGKELMFIDPTTNEGGIITLEDLTKQILNGLKSQAFALDAGQMTILQALNTLNKDPGMKFQTVKNMANKKTLKLIGTNSDQQVFLVVGMNNGKTAGIAVVSSNTIGTSDNCALKSFGDMLFSAITRKKGSYDIELTCAENYTSAIIISNENFSYRTE